MKKSIKIVSLIIVLSLFALMAMGSGSSGSSSSAITQSSADSSSGSSSSSGGTSAKKDLPVIEEQVIMYMDGVKVTAKEYVSESFMGDGIKVLIENSSPKDIGVGCRALIVNNYMITDLFSSTVAAGKKANDTIYISSNQLKNAGIENIGQIEIYLYIFDATNYSTISEAPCATIKTSLYDKMDTTPNDSGKDLYNENGVKIVGKYVSDDSFWGKAVVLYIENNSGRNISVTCEDMSINGFMMTPLFSCTVYDGKKAIDEITLLSSELEENGIKEVEEVELKFHFYDPDTFSTISDTQPITFSTK